MLGLRRIDDPHDYVRWEIATALSRKRAVLPVLTQREAMPSGLPKDLEPLSNIVAARFEAGNPELSTRLASAIRASSGLNDPAIFICYRRHGAQAAHLLRLELERAGFSKVLIDTTNVATFAQLKSALQETIASSDAVLVLMGPGWEGVRRPRALLLLAALALVVASLFYWANRDTSVAIAFVDHTTNKPTALSGQLTLVAGGLERNSDPFEQLTEVRVRDVPHEAIDQVFSLRMKTTPPHVWFRHGSDKLARHLTIGVALDPDYFYAGTVVRKENHAPLARARLLINGTKCKADTDEAGYFRFGACPDAAKTHRELRVGLEGRDFCGPLFKLQDLPNRTVLELGEDCAGSTEPANPPPSACGFRCKDGSCIDARQHCDARKDCSAGEDERACPGPTGRVVTKKNHVPVPSAVLFILGTPCETTTDEAGHFQFGACPRAAPDRLEVRVRLPGANRCEDTFNLREPPNPTVLELSEDCTGTPASRKEPSKIPVKELPEVPAKPPSEIELQIEQVRATQKRVCGPLQDPENCIAQYNAKIRALEALR